MKKEKLIKRFKEIHGNRYDYSLVKDSLTREKIKIICAEHGIFIKHVAAHLRGSGCSACSGYKKLTTKEFVKKSIETHGYKYDYSKTEYVRSREKVKIICPKHGEFLKTPNKHVSQKQGCPKCTIDSLKNTKEYFIKISKEKHGDKYDYSKVVYKNNKTKVVIICADHGEFRQEPRMHSSGQDCPMCSGIFNKSKDAVAYETYCKKLSLIGVKTRRGLKNRNDLEAECYYCRKFFTPTFDEVRHKIYSSEGKGMVWKSLFCSDECKQKCPTYRFNTLRQIDPRSKLYVPKTEAQEARACQTDHLKQIQIDQFGENFCEKCNKKGSVDLHHTLEIAKHGKDAINSASHILLCKECHVNIHRSC